MLNDIKQYPENSAQRRSWAALQYFNIYRILLSGLFVVLIYIGQLPNPLGILYSRLFSVTSHFYLITSVIFAVFINLKYPRLNLQIAFHALIDIVMLSLLMYASNGLSSGFGMLLVIAVAGGSILRAGKISILFAAIATLAVLTHELYIQFFVSFRDVNYIHAGILGATFFVTAIIGNFLASRAQASEELAEQRAKELLDLAELNKQIVRAMQSGILVLNDNLKPVLINESAKKLIFKSQFTKDVLESQISAKLITPIQQWLSGQGNANIEIAGSENYPELSVAFFKLDYGNSFQVLVFLEDTASLRQRAQQLKLASLGRLAASIAHEIRNPLGAINHAGQLISESPNLGSEDKRLTEIINDHSLRVNTIIENVLSISRREPPLPRMLNLNDWLDGFIIGFENNYGVGNRTIEFKKHEELLEVKFDDTQLHQVLNNLCDNARRYSEGDKLFTLATGIDSESERAYVDVIDNGKGMSPIIIEQLFEPFFTTEQKGTGLGLYLAKEICDANHASLTVLSSDEKGTTFRIYFMHKEKKSIY